MSFASHRSSKKRGRRAEPINTWCFYDLTAEQLIAGAKLIRALIKSSPFCDDIHDDVRSALAIAAHAEGWAERWGGKRVKSGQAMRAVKKARSKREVADV